MQTIPAVNTGDLRRVLINEQDITKSKKEILLDLLYESQGFRFPYHWLIQGIPQVLDAVPTNLWDPNTFLPIELKPGYRDDLVGDLGVLYRRRSIKEHLAQLGLTMLRFTDFPTTIHAVVQELINPHLNYPLSLEDFVDGEVTDPTATRWSSVLEKILCCGAMQQPSRWCLRGMISSCW